ncbi:MAG: enoyl-CoA hydratase/isomerase family protein [Rhizobiaceae bacterium]|nr:enoyl-CoA hydratase/isomerase family protein [Rhizobiaceae bacterium]
MPECLALSRNAQHVVHVRLNRPARRNALDAELMDAIAETFNDLSADPDVRAIVLGGSGGHFCSGADLQWMAGNASQIERETTRLATAMEAVLSCSKLVIAKVEGSVFAGGLSLVAAADVALSSNDARFALSEVRIGLAPALTTRLLFDKISPGDLRWLGATGAIIDAQRALAIGLVHAIADSASDLDLLVEDYVSGALKSSPQAIADFKQLMRELLGTGNLAPGTIAHTAFMEGRLRPAALSGISAIQSRTAPPWVPDTN